jgi:UDP-3-O-[3-hydroxymyristoyl] glucosamine N-acyltransferase
VAIGEGCILYDRITLAAGTVLGRRVMIHSGAVIGADGFKYEVGARGLLKIPQVGHVVVEDDVEIGANATIDRASFSVTRIGARTKLDNMVHIAHNCDVGSDCLIAAQTGIAGSTRIGRGVLMGGQVGIADNASVGDGCKIAAKAGIRGEIPAGAEVSGAPAIDAKRFNRVWAISTRLPEIYMKVRPLLKGLDGDEFAEL